MAYDDAMDVIDDLIRRAVDPAITVNQRIKLGVEAHGKVDRLLKEFGSGKSTLVQQQRLQAQAMRLLNEVFKLDDDPPVPEQFQKVM